MRETVRFLSAEEYGRTLPLFAECFGEDRDFCRMYYGDRGSGAIYSGRVAVLENEGEILSMVHVRNMTMESGSAVAADAKRYILPRLKAEPPGEISFGYLLCIGTAEKQRGRGYMNRVMAFAEDALRQEGCRFSLLIAVDKAIYEQRGYRYHFPLSAEAQEQLFADEGLTEGTVKFL